MNEEISIQQNEKFIQLNNQSNKIQKEIDNYEKSQMIIKEIEIYKKYNDYQQILLNFSKLKQLLPILNKIKRNQLICDSKFDRKNLIPNDLKQNLKNWKLNLPFDLNKTQNNLPDEIQLKNKLKFSILLKNKFNEIVNAQKLNPKAQIFKSNSNEIITEITKFQEGGGGGGGDNESIGEYLFKKEGEYQMNFSINNQKIPKSPFNLKKPGVIQICKEDSIQERMDGKIKTFHQNCDNRGKSIVLIKLNNESLFGGFAATDWDLKTEYRTIRRKKSFFFSLISLDRNFKEPLKMQIFKNKYCEVYCGSYCGPTFGGGHDLFLGNAFEDMNKYNYSSLGSTYEPPFGYKFGSQEAKNFLAGSYKLWDISQIDIFCEN
ncbi:pep-cterm sorting domain-containing protein [Anaeramoeba flamelloides]|uniref:Pep-cterm sorting domain-containing protein n=1 Tax=Anaeramoeba flamelloides TaxID=1746091 RepID=A0AAV7Y830_9EUKA|nr:pep-cterm sorting domain-containing protein [Anaeramoeba flamelloides]